MDGTYPGKWSGIRNTTSSSGVCSAMTYSRFPQRQRGGCRTSRGVGNLLGN